MEYFPIYSIFGEADYTMQSKMYLTRIKTSHNLFRERFVYSGPTLFNQTRTVYKPQNVSYSSLAHTMQVSERQAEMMYATVLITLFLVSSVASTPIGGNDILFVLYIQVMQKRNLRSSILDIL